MHTPLATRSADLDLLRTMLGLNPTLTPTATPTDASDGIDIASLPESVQTIIRARPDDFAEGDVARIDTEGEARKLLQRLLGAEPDAFPMNPAQESLQNLDMGEMMALLIEWLKNDGGRPEQGGGGGGRDVGQMGGPSFSGSPQPVSWNGGGGGAGSSGGGSSGGGGGGGSSVGTAPASGPAAASYPTGNLNGDRSQQVMDYLQAELGLTPAQAAGVVGNLGVESGGGLDPTAIGDGGNALGIAQWNGPRKRALESFAAQQGKPATDFGVQLQFLAHELKTSESGALASLRRTTNAGDAALVFSRDFERPGTPHNDRRVALAHQAYQQFA